MYADSSDNANESYSTTNDSSDCTDTASESSETTQLSASRGKGNDDNNREYSELRSLCRRIQTKFSLASSATGRSRDHQRGRDTSGDHTETAANSNLILTSNLSVKTLKYLQQLLALYKLDICKWCSALFVYLTYFPRPIEST